MVSCLFVSNKETGLTAVSGLRACVCELRDSNWCTAVHCGSHAAVSAPPADKKTLFVDTLSTLHLSRESI
jgi:hypothetical protein